jgi:23S rRNA-/tRNA-specific pseudouridylate synthase
VQSSKQSRKLMMVAQTSATDDSRGRKEKGKSRQLQSKSESSSTAFEMSILIAQLPLPVPVPVPIASIDDSNLNHHHLLGGHHTHIHTRIRIVKPYLYTFQSYAKARWLGRTILDIYQTEFGSYQKSYYHGAILQGRILVCGNQVDPSYLVQNSDVLSHTVHLHEPAVAVSSSSSLSKDKDAIIEVIAETDTLLVVCKPCTVPVHACGAYRENCLLRILEPQYGKLYNIHRLDRLTSGILMIAKCPVVAQTLSLALRSSDACEKMYLARVQGKFPQNCHLSVAAMDTTCWKEPGHVPTGGEYRMSRTGTNETTAATATAKDMRERNALGYWLEDSFGSVQKGVSRSSQLDLSASHGDIDEWMSLLEPPINRNNENGDTCSSAISTDTTHSPKLWFHLACPVRVSSPKHGICQAGAFTDLDDATYRKTVKPAHTSFAIVRYDESTDSTILLCRPSTGRSHQIRLHLQFTGHSIVTDAKYGGQTAMASSCTQLPVPLGNNNNDNDGNDESKKMEQDYCHSIALQQRAEGESLVDFIQKTCVHCATSVGGGGTYNDRAIVDFQRQSQGIWLHSFKYTMTDVHGKRVSYETKPPSWAI